MPDTTNPVTGEVLKDDPNYPVRGQVSLSNLTTPSGAVLAGDTNYPPLQLGDEILEDRPAMYWPLDEPAASPTVSDALGIRDGIVEGGVTLGVDGGVRTTVAQFDGLTGTGIRSDNAPDPITQLTLEAWVENDPTGDPNARILDKGNSVFAYPWSNYDLCVNSGVDKVSFDITVGPDYFPLESSVVLGAGWHHVVGRYNGIDMRIYIDGELASIVFPLTGPIADSGTPVYVGRYSADPNIVRFKGKIAHAAVYLKALSPTQIKNHYIAGLSDGIGL